MVAKYTFKKDEEDRADPEWLELQAIKTKLQKIVDRTPHGASGVTIDTLRQLLFDPEGFDA